MLFATPVGRYLFQLMFQGKDFCKHGGESNSDCTLCTNCSMGWNGGRGAVYLRFYLLVKSNCWTHTNYLAGTHCDKWIGGETDALLKGLQVIIDNSIAHQKNISHVNVGEYKWTEAKKSIHFIKWIFYLWLLSAYYLKVHIYKSFCFTPQPLPGQIGVGCDLTTGKRWDIANITLRNIKCVICYLTGHLLLPVVELTYNNANRTWTNLFGDTWRIPDQSTFEPLPTGMDLWRLFLIASVPIITSLFAGFDIPEQTEKIFETISDYGKESDTVDNPVPFWWNTAIYPFTLVHETFSTSEDKESHGGIYTSMADIQSINKVGSGI